MIRTNVFIYSAQINHNENTNQPIPVAPPDEIIDIEQTIADRVVTAIRICVFLFNSLNQFIQ
jgi:hypothetical protein